MGFGRRDVSSQGKRSPHFFKVFFPGINSEQMEVPPAFLKHIEGHPSTCSLMGPSGNVWAVEPVRNQAGRLFFVGGWKEFVGDHAMETGEFLVFVYEGGPRFRVLIFDTTACEKESAFCAFPSSSTKRARVVAPVKRSESEVEEEEEDEEEDDDEVEDSGESGEESPPPAARRMRQKRDGDWPEKRKRGPPRGRPRGRPRLLGNKIMKSRKKRSRGRLVSQRRPVTEEEIERAHRAANAFTSDYPFQVLIMRKSVVYIGHSMGIWRHPHIYPLTQEDFKGSLKIHLRSS
uniref:B3 domain-containing protein Os11g0197600 n=1 Tax=Anthurium amnicola TaxID=1678845 RepID=A0A1D1YV77_9ARAE